MKVAISATNPCHLYDLAKELARRDALAAYFSGYPAWRLHPPARFPLRTHSWRTLVTYSLLRLPRPARPNPHRLFRWQDYGFDRAVADDIAHAGGEIVHAMPGQALHTFRAARAAGIETCLNHASGPVRQLMRTMREVWAREGIAASGLHHFDEAYMAREREEYQLADWHCVASTVVRNQLVDEGVSPERIWVAPYGADPKVFFPPPSNNPPRRRRIVFAGQLTLRKGLRALFAAWRDGALPRDLELDCYGTIGPDVAAELALVQGDARVHLRGPVSQVQLAAELRQSAMLVLPSLEEAFGLVVPQALNCGVPCIVSDRVGAADLIQPQRNGSIFPTGDSAALAREITWWLKNPGRFEHTWHTWEGPTDSLLRQMTQRKLVRIS